MTIFVTLKKNVILFTTASVDRNVAPCSGENMNYIVDLIPRSTDYVVEMQNDKSDSSDDGILYTR